jgi:hypothetical protein
MLGNELSNGGMSLVRRFPFGYLCRAGRPETEPSETGLCRSSVVDDAFALIEATTHHPVDSK